MTQVDEVERIAEVLWKYRCEFNRKHPETFALGGNPPWGKVNGKVRRYTLGLARTVLSALFEGDSRRRSAGEPVTEIV